MTQRKHINMKSQCEIIDSNMWKNKLSERVKQVRENIGSRGKLA